MAGRGYNAYPGAQPQRTTYPQPTYPQSTNYPPQGGSYPPPSGQPGYPQQPGQPGYPSTQTSYPPQQQQPGYPPQLPQRTQSGYPTQTGYPPQQTGYPPQQPGYQQTGYPPQTQTAYPQQTNPPPRAQDWFTQYVNQLTPQEQQQCQQWFQLVDKDRSGSIQAIELAEVQFNGKAIGLQVATKLIKVFDRDGSGSIEFNEYCALHKFMMTMQNAFFQADSDRSGTIDSREIWLALTGAGFQISSPTVQAIVQKFDKTGRGLDFSNFLYLCGHLAHVRSIYEWNDPQRRGQIVLTFDNLAHIATDILNIV